MEFNIEKEPSHDIEQGDLIVYSKDGNVYHGIIVDDPFFSTGGFRLINLTTSLLWSNRCISPDDWLNRVSDNGYKIEKIIKSNKIELSEIL